MSVTGPTDNDPCARGGALGRRRRWNHSPVARFTTVDTTGAPSTTRHSDVANHGSPSVAFVEPSSGSTTTVPRGASPTAGVLHPALLGEHVESGREERIDAERVDFEVDVVLTGAQTGVVPVLVRRDGLPRPLADPAEKCQHRLRLVGAQQRLVLGGLHGRGR